MEAPKTIFSDAIAHISNTIALYENCLATQCVEKAPFIVEVGALTVATDEQGCLSVCNAVCPTQFTQEAVNRILSVKFTNPEGTVQPVVYSVRDWYAMRLAEYKNTLKLLEN